MENTFKILIILLTIMSNSVYASCSTIYSVTKYINFGSVVVQRDTTVGTIIATVTAPPTGAKIADCPSSGYEYDTMVYLGGIQSSTNGVYKTNIDGVGIRGDWDGYPYLNPAYTDYVNGPGYAADGGHGQTFKLVKIGDIHSGILSDGQVAKTSYDGNLSTAAVSIYLQNSSVTSVACSITTPTLNFPIGDVLASTFGSSIGTIPAGAQYTQNLGLNCDANANINVSLSGTQNPDVGTTSVLALTDQGSTGVAQGVGVQIVYNGSPLTLNNRIVLKKSAGGQETFPFTARYYQTKTAVTTGKANTSATLNLTYQ